MQKDVSKKPENELHNLDGIDGFTDEAEGEDQDQFTDKRVIQGVRIKFTNEGTWVDASKEKLAEDLELVVWDIGRVVQKWGRDNMPSAPPIFAKPNEKWPDVDAMNEKCPKSEWRVSFGKPVGPYQAQRVVYMFDPTTMNKYTFPISTNGGSVCVSEFTEKAQLMRQFRGQHVYAVVKLRSAMLSKRYERLRPDLVVQRWITLNRGGLPAPETPSITGPTAPASSTPLTSSTPPASSTPSATDALGMRTVEPPSVKEVTGDEIPW